MSINTFLCRSFGGVWPLVACAAVMHISYATSAQARQPEWTGRAYQYLVVDQDLRVVLEEFGRNSGVRVVLTPAVQGRVRGNMPNGTARTFLDGVTRAFGLDWYFDGITLFVTAGSESRTKLVDLQGRSFDEVLAQISSSDVYDDRYVIRRGPSNKTILVSGPPRFVEVVAEAISALGPTTAEVTVKPFVVTVFQGIGGPGERFSFPEIKVK